MQTRLSALNFLKAEFLRSGLGESEAGAQARRALLDTLDTDMNGLLMSLNSQLTEEQERRIKEISVQHREGIPLAYILGRRFFYGRSFFVDDRVLIPRWETELLCERAIELIREEKLESGLDMCTGSGCIALTLALETGISMKCADISPAALAVAEKNARELGAHAEFILSDMFSQIEGSYPLITINPPYITTEEYSALDAAVREHEPKGALLGGKDGLDFYRRIANEAGAHLDKGGTLLLEIGAGQGQSVCRLLQDDYSTELIKDYAGHDRVVQARKR